MNRFENKVVLITGAASGIGKATAARFAAEGAKLVLVDRNQVTLEEVANSLNTETLVQVADVGEERAVQAVIDATLATFGQLDVLVNNAGFAVAIPLTDISYKEYRDALSTLVDGVFLFSRAAIPHLLKSKGCIVNTGSVSGMGGDWGMPVYNLAKGAVTNFTRALALDYGKHGVRVNAVAPTLTRTAMSADIFEKNDVLEKAKERVALGRLEEPEDVAPVIAFLASSDAAYVTGVILPVDGGLTASNGQPIVT